MTGSEILTLWSQNLALSLIIWIVIIEIILYLVRIPAHKAISSLFNAIRNGLRLISRSSKLAVNKIEARNKEVLLAAGEENMEHQIEKEFYRVNTVVKRDLGSFPTLQKTLSEQITRIDEDYQESSELPPPSPEWLAAVDAIVKIKTKSPAAYEKILSDIHKSTVSQNKVITEEYRHSVGKRHELLSKMMPYWRKVEQTLTRVGKSITGLNDRSKAIDNKMKLYEEIQKKTDKAHRALASSSLTQCFVSSLFLVIAVGVAIVNLHLISLPLSDVLGTGAPLDFPFGFSFPLSDVFAFFVILIEAFVGLLLMETVGLTKLVPLIGQTDDRKRKYLFWILLTFIFLLAFSESALAFIRERIAANQEAFNMTTMEGENVELIQRTTIPMIVQMVLGFILPFILAFLAIPIELFVHSVRTLLGVLFSVGLLWLAFLLRLIGNISLHTGKFFVNLYDLLIAPCLWIESKITAGRKHSSSEDDLEEDEDLAGILIDEDMEESSK